MKIVISGGSGFIGSALIQRLLSEKNDVVMLTRHLGSSNFEHQRLRSVQWDGIIVAEWAREIDGADAVINLAGELIAGKRWSATQKRNILESRINATRAIVSAIRQAKKKPEVLVSASAVGYYGDMKTKNVSEGVIKGKGFLADVCEQWEQAAKPAAGLGVRVVNPRIGVVLGNNGGALPKMLIPFKMGFGGWMGSGEQWFPWIHRDDVVNAILFAIHNNKIDGALNLAAPESVSMKEFCKVLGSVMHRPAWAPVPEFVLKIALGEMSEMLLTGQNVIPKKLVDNGYTFLYPDLKNALSSIVGKK